MTLLGDICFLDGGFNFFFGGRGRGFDFVFSLFFFNIHIQYCLSI